MVAVVVVLCFACCLASVPAYLLIKAGHITNAAATPGATIDPRLATLTVATSPEKATLIQGLADQFNAQGQRTPDGQAEKIAVVTMAPDEMVAEALATPSFQAMTPDSSLWLDQLNRKWAASQKVEPGQLPTTLADEPVRYAITPIVIAAWEDSARSLGWPNQPVGWTSLQDRARQDPGFKWSHSSTSFASGLLATLAEFYAGAGVQRNLTAAQAQDPKTVAFVTAVEKTVHFYGESELDTIKRAAQDGPTSLNAFVVSEQLVVAFNTGAFGKTPGRLVALYPTEGTLWDDHPLALLELPSVTANQRRTFQAFRDYLTSKDVQNQILSAGYRPTDLSIPLNGPTSPLTSANGVDPTEPQTTLQLPPADVVSVVENVSLLTRRKTNIFLVVDTSGSMQGAKLDNVKAALKTFVAEIPSDQERVGLVEFNSTVVNVIELKTLAENRDDLNQSIDGFEAGGNTALFDAVATAYDRLQQAGDQERINAIVVMTDGIENASNISLGQLIDKIQTGNNKLPVVIFTIAYGSDADTGTLKSIAAASGGQERDGTPDNIRTLYQDLSNYF
jgi:Ca-activated chloride channel family protein